VSVPETLKEHKAELHKLGVLHASVFGSVSRGQTHPDSDIDVLIDLDPERQIGVFEYARVKLYLNERLGGTGDIVNGPKAQAIAAQQYSQ